MINVLKVPESIDLPTTSILIPVHNREAYIGECIESALKQTISDFEIVIVDNASTDKTWTICQEYAKKDKRIKIFQNMKNLGPVLNWKRCVDEAKGKFGKFLWSDDLIAPSFLEKTIPLFNNDVGFVYTGASIFTDIQERGNRVFFLEGTGLYPTETYIQYALYDEGVPFSPGCAIFRMNDLKDNLLVNVPNKVNSDFSMHAIGNDLLIFLLTANAYKEFGFIDEKLSFFRKHNVSITISSKPGKVTLHYALAKAYFVDHFKQMEREKLAAFIKIKLWRYRSSKEYGIEEVNDFFISPVRLNMRLLMHRIINVLKKRIFK